MIRPAVAVFFCLTFSLARLYAGGLSYVGMTCDGTDWHSGIGGVYTAAVDPGNTTGIDRVINGALFVSLVGIGSSSSAGGVTFKTSSGSLANAGGVAANLDGCKGMLGGMLSDACFAHAADKDSAQNIILNTSSLQAGATYGLRLYICNWSNQNRLVDLAFTGDGGKPVSTGFFNEDDARSSEGAFPAANQVYYIEYRYVWDGRTVPEVAITQKDPRVPFHLYGLSNQLLKEPQPGASPSPAPDESVKHEETEARPRHEHPVKSHPKPSPSPSAKSGHASPSPKKKADPSPVKKKTSPKDDSQ